MDGPQYEEMLLVFDKPSCLYLKMKNSLLSLMAAYITGDGLIFNLYNMQTQTAESNSPQSQCLCDENEPGMVCKEGPQPGVQNRGIPLLPVNGP